MDRQKKLLIGILVIIVIGTIAVIAGQIFFQTDLTEGSQDALF